MKTYYVYILASERNGTLYIGVTNDLIRRVYEHKRKLVKGFTAKYDINMLIYFEDTNDINTAIEREKQLKKWNREWKIELIQENNPEWKDLYYENGGTDDMYDEYYEELKKSRFPLDPEGTPRE